MAYQNVGSRPRFYVDWNTYFNALGLYTGTALHNSNGDGKGSYMGMGMLNPTNQRFLEPNSSAVSGGASIRYNSDNWVLDPEQVNWAGVLGHNLKTVDSSYYFSLGVDVGTTDLHYPAFNAINDIVNSNYESEIVRKPQFDGFSLVELNGTNATYTIDPSKIRKNHLAFSGISSANVGEQFKFGSWCIGNYYDISSPDLNVSLEYQYDGIKTSQSAGGASLTNTLYTGPAKWGDYGPWQLGGVDSFRTGRRVWTLNWSFLADTEIFPINANTSYQAETTDGYGDNFTQTETADGVSLDFTSNILSGTDFFSSVWNRTAGSGNLPFIFNPDGGGDTPNNNPDQFAICRFDMKSLKITQKMHRKYSVSLKIKECW
tara:strand:- start:991 stop:2109 length:1119 start_codon:yes stop_codon:yes gene_type:complete